MAKHSDEGTGATVLEKVPRLQEAENGVRRGVKESFAGLILRKLKRVEWKGLGRVQKKGLQYKFLKKNKTDFEDLHFDLKQRVTGISGTKR